MNIAESNALTPYDTLVIGAGQAGLAAGYHLKRAGARFALLDGAGEIGSAWKERWDSLRLFTPARYNSLPGMPFPGERYSLPGKDDVAEYLKAYAKRFDLPVRLHSRVRSLRREAGVYAVEEESGEILKARSVIVASGANQRPYVPAFAATVKPYVLQLHSSGYRRPSQIPSGSVLVVGAGNSGAQIALELAEAGRRVTLSGPDTGSLPRRFLGRDVYDWLWPTLMRPPVDSALGRRLMQGRLFSGDPLIGVSTKKLERVGRTTAVRDGFAAVVWCTGFRPEFGWIELPAFGLDGYPLHRRGIVQSLPGLAFVGMRYQYRFGSALLGGVGGDAEYVVSQTLGFVRSAGWRASPASPTDTASRFPRRTPSRAA